MTSHKKTDRILALFELINKIPRCSGNEKAISEWVGKFAEARGFKMRSDSAGNFVVKIPASQGMENAPVIVLQGHMDMVCEKTPDSDHDFSKDPITHIYEGNWVKAEKTTLGADDGIGIAILLAIAEDEDIRHPPLELLFTADEESGLVGALEMESGLIDGKILINLDSEDEGVFTVGCAGGKTTEIILPVQYETVAGEHAAFRLNIGGLKGGHSGVDIHKNLANANVLLARILDRISVSRELGIAHIEGGTAHNAIPREAEALAVCRPNDLPAIRILVSEFETIAQSEFSGIEKNLAVKLFEEKSPPESAATPDNSLRLIRLLMALQYGVSEMSPEMSGIVETSANLAQMEMKNGALHVAASQRSLKDSKVDAATYKTEAIARLAGAEVSTKPGYPAWRPDKNSPLLGRSRETYQRLFGKEPEVLVIHAGLECGVIGAKHAGMDMISIGPTIESPHSPAERLNIPSIGKIWDFLVELLKS